MYIYPLFSGLIKRIENNLKSVISKLYIDRILSYLY